QAPLGLVERLATAGEDGHRGALLGEQLGDGPSHPLGPAGHRRVRTVQSQIHQRPSTVTGTRLKPAPKDVGENGSKRTGTLGGPYRGGNPPFSRPPPESPG